MVNIPKNRTGVTALVVSGVCLALAMVGSLFRISFLNHQNALIQNSASALISAPNSADQTEKIKEEQSAITAENFHTRTIFLGSTGVSWDLINPKDTPAIFNAATRKSAQVANFVVKVKADTACPDDGWLTVNTGVRTNGLAKSDERCRVLPQFERLNSATDNRFSGWRLKNWRQYQEANSENKYHPNFGNLTQALQKTKTSTAAIGAGAALALVDTDGKLASDITYQPIETAFPSTQSNMSLATAPQNDAKIFASAFQKAQNAQLVIADLGNARNSFSALTAEKMIEKKSATAFHASFHLPHNPTPALKSAVQIIDSRFTAVIQELFAQDTAFKEKTGKSRQTTIIFASLAESDRSGAKMQTYFAVNLADLRTQLSTSSAINSQSTTKNNEIDTNDESHLAYTNSTRIPGIAQNTDILPTLVANSSTAHNAIKTTSNDGILQNAVGSLITKYSGTDSKNSAVDYLKNQGKRAKYTRGSIGYALTALATILVFATFILCYCLRYYSRQYPHTENSQVCNSDLRKLSNLHKLEKSKTENKISKITRENTRNNAKKDAKNWKIRFFSHGMLALGAIPVSTFLVNLLPWWNLPFAQFFLLLFSLIFAGIISSISLIIGKYFANRGGFTQKSATRNSAIKRTQSTVAISPAIIAVMIVAGITAITLIIDVITGSYLHFSSIFGVQAQHAGRFYGFGNSAFVIFAISILLLTAFGLHLMRYSATPIWQRGIFVMIMLALAIYIDGSPVLGADFGGPPALVLAFILLLALHLGRKMNPTSLISLAFLGVFGTFGIAIFDWLKPKGKRTHLGEFIDSVLQGDFLLVVSRKFGEMFTDISIYVWLVVAFSLFVTILLARKHSSSILLQCNKDFKIANICILPTDFMICKSAIIVLLLFALTINDSGLLLPFIGLIYGLPLYFSIMTGNLAVASKS